MNYVETTKKDCQYQQALLRKYKAILLELPEGKLVRARRGNYDEYYHVLPDGRRLYVRKDEVGLLEELRLRKNLEEAVWRMENNIDAQQKLLQAYLPYDFQSLQACLPSTYRSERAPDLSQAALRGRDKSEEDRHPRRNLPTGMHTSSSGLAVRSKTELMIVEMLTSEGLDFAYEKPLQVRLSNGNHIFAHPDFTFYDHYGCAIYWEHFGMLGEDRYRESAVRKIKTYVENDIIPSVNFVITAENLDGTLDVGAISRTIEMVKDML